MKLLFKINDSEYRTRSGICMKREYGLSPNGNKFGGIWVLRDSVNSIIDFDKYSNDILERNNLKYAPRGFAI